MKKNYLKFILILILNNILFAQNKYWEIIDSNKMGGDYYFAGIKCADSLNCIERIWVNNNGDMLKITTNGGKSWNNISNYPGYTIQDMVYPDTNLIIAACSVGNIIRSTDMGITWKKTNYDTNAYLYNICMLDKDFGLLSGCTGNCYGSESFYLETTNGGYSWDKIDFPIMFDVIDLKIFNRNIFYGYGRVITKEGKWKNYFVKTFDNWKTFDTLNITEPNVGVLSAVDTNNIWLAGGYTDQNHLPNTTQIIIHSSDGGKTWDTQRNQKKNGCPIFSIKFIDENYGMATSCLGLVLMTTNGGKNWIETTILYPDSTSGLDYSLDNLQMPTKNTAYVRCTGYYIYKFNGDWPTDVPEPPKPNNFTIFPNPVESELTLNFLPEYQTSQIKIYSVEGIEVLETEYKDKIDVSGFTPGVYYIMIKDKVLRFIKL